MSALVQISLPVFYSRNTGVFQDKPTTDGAQRGRRRTGYDLNHTMGQVHYGAFAGKSEIESPEQNRSPGPADSQTKPAIYPERHSLSSVSEWPPVIAGFVQLRYTLGRDQRGDRQPLGRVSVARCPGVNVCDRFREAPESK